MFLIREVSRVTSFKKSRPPKVSQEPSGLPKLSVLSARFSPAPIENGAEEYRATRRSCSDTAARRKL